MIQAAAPAPAHLSRQAWVLFAAMSVIWGIPYLFIKIAVTELSPAAVAGGRTLLAVVILVPLAARQGALRPALRLWPWAVAFGLIEMAIPWVLLVPVIALLVWWLTGRWQRRRASAMQEQTPTEVPVG